MPSKSNFLEPMDDKKRIKLLESMQGREGIGLVRRIDDISKTGGLDYMPKGLLEKKGRVPTKEGTPRIYGEVVMKPK